MQNGRRNRVGRQECFRFGVPPVSACPACFCRSLPARACPSFLFGQSRQQMVSFRCRGTGFPACRMRNGRRNRGGRLLRFRFGVSSVCIVRAATESPRRGGLPRSFTHPIRPVSGRVVTGGICFHGMCGESGCVAARGGGGSGRQGRTQLPGMPSHLLRSGTGSHRRHLLPRGVGQQRMCGCAWRGRER